MEKLNFGCGNDLLEDWHNVDIQRDKKVHKSFDFNKFPYPLEESKYDYIYSRCVLEHLDRPLKVIEELWRISKDGATIEIIVPYYHNKAAYSALDHKYYFNDTAFYELKRKTTVIDKKVMFKKISIDMVPTKVGTFFPRFIREKLDLFIGGLISELNVRLIVNKKKR